MNQHPIPQNVTQYQFRLIGDMTIKQFLFLAAGIGLAILSFNLPLLPIIFKWPVAIMMAFGGAAVAFLPINDRPMSVWLLNFFRAIYAPTFFIWKKNGLVPDYLTYKAQKSFNALPPIKAKDSTQLTSFVSSLKQQGQNQLDQLEDTKLRSLDSLFKQASSGMSSPQPQAIPTTPMTDQKPAGTAPRIIKAVPSSQQINAAVSMQQIHHLHQQQSHITPLQANQPAHSQTASTIQTGPGELPSLVNSQPSVSVGQTSTPAGSSPIPSQLSPAPTVSSIPLQATPPQPARPQTTTIHGSILVSGTPAAGVIVEILDLNGQTLRTTRTSPQGGFAFPLPLPFGNYLIHCEHPLAQFVDTRLAANSNQTPPLTINGIKSTIPPQPTPYINPSAIPSNFNIPAKPILSPPPNSTTPAGRPAFAQSLSTGPVITKAPSLSPPMRVESSNKAVQPPPPAARYQTDIEIPITPDTPNALVGMTLTASDQLITNAIIEVLDHNNFPVRTVKSNNLGQFFITTPLNPGFYTIKTEHVDYKFNPIPLQINGSIIHPVKLIAIAG